MALPTIEQIILDHILANQSIREFWQMKIVQWRSDKKSEDDIAIILADNLQLVYSNDESAREDLGGLIDCVSLMTANYNYIAFALLGRDFQTEAVAALIKPPSEWPEPYYIYREGNTLGPFSYSQIRIKWANHELNAEDQAYHTPSEKWRPLRELAEPWTSERLSPAIETQEIVPTPLLKTSPIVASADQIKENKEDQVGITGITLGCFGMIVCLAAIAYAVFVAATTTDKVLSLIGGLCAFVLLSNIGGYVDSLLCKRARRMVAQASQCSKATTTFRSDIIRQSAASPSLISKEGQKVHRVEKAMRSTNSTPAFMGSGKSGDDPVIINAPNSMVGIAAEYAWLEARYGTFPPSIFSSRTDASTQGWKIVNREPSTDYTSYRGQFYSHPGRTMELFELRHEGGESVVVYFDITSFF
jgi:hypothetical protein